MDILRRYLPILTWGPGYSRKTFVNELVSAVILTAMLVPQAMAYAVMAGLPPVVGLYASMAPLVMYTIFGTARTLAVGPVAAICLMTATAASQVAAQGTPEYLGATIALALLTGILLIAMGLLRLGFVVNFVSHPVLSGFILALAVQMVVGQLASVLGVRAAGDTLLANLRSMIPNLAQTNVYNAAVGLGSIAFLLWARRGLSLLLRRLGIAERPASLLGKLGPVIALVVTTLAVWGFGLSAHGVSIVGAVPKGLPGLALPPFDAGLWSSLVLPALSLVLVSYLGSISSALTLAARRRERVDPDQELIALGAANLGSAVSGGFPVTGGLTRSAVAFDAGAETPAAGTYTAIGVALATMFMTPLFFYLPTATLAAIIIVAVLPMVTLKAFNRTYAYSATDGAALAATAVLTMVMGSDTGLKAGVGLSIILHLYQTSRPHVAVLGQLPGTMTFRNVTRHAAVTTPEILSLRVDASLYFPNARFLEDLINQSVTTNPAVRHIILECPAVNTIDSSALESLAAINQRLKAGGITLHLSEVKGPVMDRLQRSHFLQELTGKVHLTQFDAVSSINPELARQTLQAERKEPGGSADDQLKQAPGLVGLD
jgi:SulP family sulfate permease